MLTSRREFVGGLALASMFSTHTRLRAAVPAELLSRDPQSAMMRAEAGWAVHRVTQPSPLIGSNGLRFGPDGRLYIAQTMGSAVSAFDFKTNKLSTIIARGGPVVSPDDLAFDSRGNLYLTELFESRISRRAPNGRVDILYRDMEMINGIVVHHDRIFVDECREGATLREIFADGRPSRILAEDLPVANSPAVGPDNAIYFPVMVPGEVWRVPMEGGKPQKVCDGLVMPDAVKFDRKGVLHVTTLMTGEIFQVDIATGKKKLLATFEPGLDNFEIDAKGYIYVSSNVRGGICEIAPDGRRTMRVAQGLIGPAGITVANDGTVYVADGNSVAAADGEGSTRQVFSFVNKGYPGFVRGVAALRDGQLALATSASRVVIYDPRTGSTQMVAEGLDDVHGIAIAPDGALIVVETGKGRILSIAKGKINAIASGLARPIDVAFDSSGTLYASESATGRIVAVGESRRTIASGLQRPEGIACVDGMIVVADSGARKLLGVNLQSGETETILDPVAIGMPRGVTLKPIMGRVEPVLGRLTPYTGVTADKAGTIYLSADGEGSIIAVTRQKNQP